MFNKSDKVKLGKQVNDMLTAQNEIVNQLKDLNKNLKGGSIGTISINSDGLTLTSKFDEMESSISGCVKQADVKDIIKDEVTYLSDYKKFEENNSELLDFVKEYCKYKDKYDLLNVAKRIKSVYKIPSKLTN